MLNILRKEKVKRDKELSDKFKQLVEFTQENGVVSFDSKGGNVVFQRLTKLSGALTEAQLATISAKADLQAAQSMAGEPARIKQFAQASFTAGSRAFVNEAQTRLLGELKELQVQLENLRYHCTEEHPAVQATRAGIEHIKEQLDSQTKKLADDYLELMHIRWKTAKQREDELLASFDAQQQAAELGYNGNQRRMVNVPDVEMLATGNEVELVTVVPILSVSRKVKQELAKGQVRDQRRSAEQATP